MQGVVRIGSYVIEIMQKHILPMAFGLAVAMALSPVPARAGVIVLTNRTQQRVSCTTIQPDGHEVQHDLECNDVAAVFTAGSVTVAFRDGEKPLRYVVQPNGIYVFHSDGKKLQLMQQPIPGLPKLPSGESAKQPAGPCVIPIKLLVDDKEPRVQSLWEKHYRDRLTAASAILEKACGVRFEVVAVERWTSNNARDFLQLMGEYEQRVQPAPARLALGFTGQFDTLREDIRIGGSKGPFRPHVLIREWGGHVTEPERLAILVHELSHYLGAAHSAEPQSIMQPMNDHMTRVRGYRIRFDALNTLAMCLMCEELRRGWPASLMQLPTSTKDQLRPIYEALRASLPNDPAAPIYLTMLKSAAGLIGATAEHQRAVLIGASRVVQAVSQSAKNVNPMIRQDGERLTAHYVRAAAAAAGPLPQDVAGEAFLLGLGVALSDASTLPGPPILAELWRQIEPPQARATRLESFGTPTMRSRHDSVEHFAMSAALTALVGPQTAETAGMLKEISDAQGGTGFSFVDLSSDLAGISFAQAVIEGRQPLSRIEKVWAVEDFLPTADGLREGIAWPEFATAYGNPPDIRWMRQRQAILKKVLELPGYKMTNPR